MNLDKLWVRTAVGFVLWMQVAGTLALGAPAYAVRAATVANTIVPKAPYAPKVPVQPIAKPMTTITSSTWEPNCNEVLKYNSEKFADIYVQKIKMENDMGYDMAYQYWAKCRQEQALALLDNDVVLKNKIVNLNKLFISYISADYQLATQMMGGGTLYKHVQVQNSAVLAEGMYQIVQIYMSMDKSKIASPYLLSSVNTNKTLIAKNINTIQSQKSTSLMYTSSSEWNSAVSKYMVSYKNILAWNNNKNPQILAILYGLLADLSQVDNWNGR